MLNTIIRTGEVLELFTQDHPEWGVTEIAHALDVPKSNAHEIVSSLAAIDLLRRTGRSRYRLGWRIMMMAREIVDATAIRRHAPGIMTALSRETGQTVHIAVWDGRNLIFIARVLGERGVHQAHAEAGTPIEAHCTASGKVLLADLPWTEVMSRMSRDRLHPRTPNSVRDLGALSVQLEQVRRDGIALNREEADAGIAGIAVPVQSVDGHAMAALGVSMRAAELDEFRARHEALLRRLAATLSVTLRQAPEGPSDEARPGGAVGA